LDDFFLSETLFKELCTNEEIVPLTIEPQLNDFLRQMAYGSADRIAQILVRNDYLYIRPHFAFSLDDVGVIRISFRKVPADWVGIVSQQMHNTFKPHNFVKDEHNLRSRVFAQRLEERRANAPFFIKPFMISQQDMDEQYEVAKRGRFEGKDHFFRSVSAERKGWKWLRYIGTFVFLMVASVLLQIGMFPAKKSLKKLGVEIGIISVIWELVCIATLKYAISPEKAIKLSYWCVILILLYYLQKLIL
jgi:hypothetical protein